jgi:hypothetical protein
MQRSGIRGVRQGTTTMKMSALIAGLVGLAVIVGGVFLACVWVVVSADFALMAGGIGFCPALWVHHRQGAEQLTSKDKAILGGVLAAATLVLGIILHLVFAPFKDGILTILGSTLLSFGFPFILGDSYWQALKQHWQKKS